MTSLMTSSGLLGIAVTAMGDASAITSAASAVFIELEDYDQDLATPTTFGKQRKVETEVLCFSGSEVM